MRVLFAISLSLIGNVASAQTIPPQAIAAFTEGKRLLKDRQSDAAIEKLEQAVELAPEYGEAWTELGNAHLEKQEFEDAVGAFESALKVKPDQTVARYNLAFSLRKLGRYAKAAEQYRRYLEQQPNDADAHYGLAEALRAAGDPLGAADAYDAYARTEKNPAQKKWVEKAKETAEELRAQAKKSQQPEAKPIAVAAEKKAQGNLHLSFTGSAPKEREELSTNESAPVRKGKRPESFQAGLMHLQNGDYAAALPRLVTADREQPNDPLILAAIASAHLGLENGREAEAMYEQAIARASSDALPGLYLGLGEARRLLGKRELALDAYNRALAHERSTNSIKRFSMERIAALK